MAGPNQERVAIELEEKTLTLHRFSTTPTSVHFRIFTVITEASRDLGASVLSRMRSGWQGFRSRHTPTPSLSLAHPVSP